MKKVAKVPMVMQMEMQECGAAALCMILAYYKKWLPLEEVRTDCGVSRDGSSAKNVIKAARNYGLDATGYSMEVNALKKVDFPVIIHWNFNHFVVLNGFKKNMAVINDPARGTVKISMDEFENAFTGIVLLFKKTENFKPEGKPKSVWKFAVNRLKGSSHMIIFVMLMSICTALLGIIMPMFSRIFIDEILSGQDSQWLIYFMMAMGIAVIVQFIMTSLSSLIWLRINGRFAISSSAEFMWHILRLPIGFFSQRWAGDIISRQKSNVDISGNLIRKFAPILINFGLLIFYLVIMINYSLALTIIGVINVILNIIFTRFASKKIMNISRTQQASGAQLLGVTMNGIGMIETIKASGSENGFFERWAGYFAKEYNAEISIARWSQYFGTIPQILQQITSIAILISGAYLILDGNLTIGMLLAFQGFLYSFLSPVSQLIDVGKNLITMRAEMERVEDVLNYKIEDVWSAKDKRLYQSSKLKGKVEVKNITFGYNNLEKPLISNFSLALESGSSVALVGSSGCGKSTIAKLITGLYKPWSGEILFDGNLRDEIDEYVYKSSVAMADQDVVIFEDSVVENIRMWDKSIENFAVIVAAKDAGIHDVIISKPDGYSYKFIEGGKNFSGGQRQCIEIARVLAQEPTIILLDEATSALDTKTEEVVMENIKKTGATRIIVSHRLSTIRDCDEIIVLDHGQVVERGTHEELYAKGGKYFELYR